jgi:CDP-diacylglycerol--serine O-phosphatidyltransferase
MGIGADQFRAELASPWNRDFLPSRWSGDNFPFPWVANLLQSPLVLAGIAVVFSFLLISPLPMFSFMVKQEKWKGNGLRYVFLSLSLGLAIVFCERSMPVIILLYILLSAGKAVFTRSAGKEN